MMEKKSLADALKELAANVTEKSTVEKDDYDDVVKKIKQEEWRKLKLDNDAKEAENRGDSQDPDQRKLFAEKIFTFVSLYMFSVFFILVLCGSPSNFQLSDTVLVTLLGTTTANVIGILIIVVTYLFSRKKK